MKSDVLMLKGSLEIQTSKYLAHKSHLWAKNNILAKATF